MSQLELLERRLAREQKARQQAELVLEEKSWQLFQANEQLRHLNDNLALEVKHKVEELQKSENRYRQLIESVEDIIYKISPDGYFTFVNSVVEQYLGYTETELIGSHFIGLVLPDYRTPLIGFYQSMLHTRLSSTYHEFPVRTKDGRTVWIGQTVRLIDTPGAEPELVAVARDITKRKATEDAFHTTQARLASLITNLQTGVVVEDENRRIILVNQLYCDLFGIDQVPEALAGQAYQRVAVPPAPLFADSGAFTRRMNEAVRNRCAVIDEVVCLADNRMLEWDYIPIFLEGQYRGHLWQFTDITEKYRADERIRRSEEKYRGIMNTMELGLLEVDNENIIRQAYDQFCRMVGYTTEELVGQSAPALLLPEEFRQSIASERATREGGASSHELQLIRKDGEPIWVLVSGAPILDESGAITGSMVIHYEITERKHLEQELARARQIAEAARHTEKQFLANMSHEIRTPLNAILGFSNLLELSALNAEQNESVRFIRTAGKNLLTIVNDILDISKIEAGMLPLESIPFSISSMADSIQTMMQPTAADKHLRLVVDTDPALPPVVLGDPTRLTQILLNLLSNAIKFTRQGSITAWIEKRDETADTVRVRFTVRDTGIGMDADVLPHIFERFRQASDFTTRYYGGTGLGLNIVKSLTEMQGGWVTVVSTPDEGSCFTLEIPYRIAPVQAEPPAALSVPSGPDGRPITILVVEDNYMNQQLALQVLKRLGCTAQIAENGEQALVKLQQEPFDLVLMDIQMPVMDGYATTSHIRHTLKNPVPIIAMTAHALASEREQCLQVGMNDFLPKPFQIDELQRIMRKYAPGSPSAAPVYRQQATRNLPAAPASCFSMEPLLEAVANDRSFAIEVLDLFWRQTPDEIRQLRDALQTNDLVTVSSIIHTQKVPIQMFGLTDAIQQIVALETLLADRTEPARLTLLVTRYLQVLEVELRAIERTLTTERARLATSQ